MQAEFLAEDVESVQFLAINAVGHSSGIEAATASVTLPLLEDTTSDDVWSAWNAEWRDLIILDGNLEEVKRINLTHYDLGESENYVTLQDDLQSLADAL